jgi:hypothetical protein
MMIAEGTALSKSFLMIFSAANLASASDAESSGVTMLDIVLPDMKAPGFRIGVMAARQCPGLRS